MTFLPTDQDRLQQIQERWRRHPGSAPGGTGSTGLGRNDRKGYESMLEEQRWALDALQEQAGKDPMQVRAFQSRAEGPGFAQLYQQNPDTFHHQNKAGQYTYNPRNQYEANSLAMLRGWRG